MDEDAGKGRLPDVSPELTRLRTILEIRKQDLKDTVAKIVEALGKSVEKLEELIIQQTPNKEALLEVDRLLEEVRLRETTAGEVVAKLIGAYEDLTKWYEKSLLGRK